MQKSRTPNLFQSPAEFLAGIRAILMRVEIMVRKVCF